MTRDEALAVLALDARATDGEVARAFESAYNLLRTQIDHAPNARLQEAIGEQLRRVEQAHAALLGASGAAAYDDLPASAPVASLAAPPAPLPIAPAPEVVHQAAAPLTPVATAAPPLRGPARRWLAGGGVAVALLLLALYAWPRARRGAESPDVLFARGRSAFDAREFARALPDLEAAARQGHREARYLTGELYGGGFDGVERADDRGRPWLMLAADSGHAGAMYELGERYSTGDGVARNYTSAVGWYRRAADLGHAEAQRSLGNNYITGVGIPTGPDTAEAARWYGRAADGGDAEAAFRLATLHEQGHGVARDLPRALTLYRQAIPRRTDAAGAVERVERAITRGER